MCSLLLLQGGHLASASRPCFGAGVLSFWHDAWGISALEKPCLQHPAVGASTHPLEKHPTVDTGARPLEKHLAVGTSTHPC